MDKLLTIAQLSDETGINRRTLLRWCRNGLPCHTLGYVTKGKDKGRPSKLMVYESDFNRYFREYHEVKPFQGDPKQWMDNVFASMDR